MKLLMIYVTNFSYKTTSKTLVDFPDVEEEASIENSLVGFIHVEKEDEEMVGKIVTKLIKNLKWAATKNSTKSIVLHSFVHLSESKADPAITKDILDKADERLKNAGYEVKQTPFGYFLDLKIDAPGLSRARIFRDLQT